MSACREGGVAIERALRQLDRSYFGTLFRESLRGLRDHESARDLVQDTFIKVWLRCATFQGESELLPWIKAILRHGLLDRLRRSGGEVTLETGDAQSPEIQIRIAELSEELIPRPDTEAARAQLDDCFQRCWQRFEIASPSHALVIAWIVEDGLTHEEIGELLGRTPGATREFISQCRKRARLHLSEWYELAFGRRETA
jgi:RNA polymerase sigma factor (sigma-70 family)